MGSPCAIWAVDCAAEKISISDAAVLRRLVHGALAEPAELVCTDDLDELVLVLDEAAVSRNSSSARHETGGELLAEQARPSAPRAVRDGDRCELADSAGTCAAALARSGRGARSMPNPRSP